MRLSGSLGSRAKLLLWTWLLLVLSLAFLNRQESRCFECLWIDEIKGRLGQYDDIGSVIIPHDEVIYL